MCECVCLPFAPLLTTAAVRVQNFVLCEVFWLGITYCKCSASTIALKPSLSTVWVGTTSLHTCTVIACNVLPLLAFLHMDSDHSVTQTTMPALCFLSFNINITTALCVRAEGCSQTIPILMDIFPHSLVLPLQNCLSQFYYLSKHENMHLISFKRDVCAHCSTSSKSY